MDPALAAADLVARVGEVTSELRTPVVGGHDVVVDERDPLRAGRSPAGVARGGWASPRPDHLDGERHGWQLPQLTIRDHEDAARRRPLACREGFEHSP
jgi:hypothetical protein